MIPFRHRSAAWVLALLLGATAPALADPFEPGSFWNGSRHVKGHRGLGNWSLTITERKGEAFAGFIRLMPEGHPGVTVAVQGKAAVSGNGPVSFRTEEKGGLQQHYFGRVKNNAIDLDFKGDSRGGKPVQGSAFLSRKK